MSYILEDFEDDKRGYRQMHSMLSEGGSDLVHSEFLKLTDENTKRYWLLLLNDMVTEMTGLYESMLADTSDYQQILEKIGAK